MQFGIRQFGIRQFLWVGALVALGAMPLGTSARPGDADSVLSRSIAAEVDEYLAEIQRLERDGGAFDASLGEQLLGLGLALQDAGRHEDAISAFKRGVHIARVSDGLYSRQQLPLLEAEIQSHVAIGDFTAADERQGYLLRVQQRALTDRRLRGQALMRQAQWQRQAYELDLGEQSYARLLNMWNLYRGALSEYAEEGQSPSPELLPPLHGMLRAQYLISGFEGSLGGDERGQGTVLRDEQGQFLAYRSQSLREGKAVIRAIYEVQQAQPGHTPQEAADTVVMMGDWLLWHGKRNEAIDAYKEALTVLAELEQGEVYAEALFGAPVALPVLAGVEAIPRQVDEERADLILEFGVSDRGRVTDLDRLDEYDHNDGAAYRFMRELRKTQFRPRFEAGEPVETPVLRWAVDTREWSDD